MAGIGTCLWFDGNAAETANFCVGLFLHSRIVEVARWGKAAPASQAWVVVAACSQHAGDRAERD